MRLHARHSCSVFTALWCGCFVIKLPFYFYQTPSWLWLVGATLSEPHTCGENGKLSIYIYMYMCVVCTYSVYMHSALFVCDAIFPHVIHVERYSYSLTGQSLVHETNIAELLRLKARSYDCMTHYGTLNNSANYTS